MLINFRRYDTGIRRVNVQLEYQACAFEKTLELRGNECHIPCKMRPLTQTDNEIQTQG